MNKGRILIVDDQEEILDSLAAILTDEGHEVLRARDGQTALHMVQSDAPDMVFLDIWIPGIDGMQTLKAIKRISPDCSVVMMSGHGTIETAVKAIKLGATDYLEKPLNLEDVLHLVQKAIADRRSPARPREGNGSSPGAFIGESSKAIALRRSLENAAQEVGSVWLTGESGTGKEFLARMIHFLEGKDRNSLIKVLCQDLTEANIDEVLCGKRISSQRTAPGKMSQAAGGALLLVRVDRIARTLKTRLAQVLREHVQTETSRGISPVSHLRIISTSVADPETLLRGGHISQDLADILAKRVIRVPTLRERREDIPLLVDHFLNEAVTEFDRDIRTTDEEAMTRLIEYSWPGNVKELKILMEHVAMTAPGPDITVNDLLIPSNHKSGLLSRDSIQAGLYESDQLPNEPFQSGQLRASGRVKASALSDSQKGSRRLRRQKTLRGSVVMYGQGLHTGEKTGLTLSPLPPYSGIIFGHITSGDTVPAVLENVDSTDFSTSLKGNGALARTVEHLMAVFHVYGLSNVMVKISGEVPIMDGSAAEFCGLVESAEIITQEEPIEEIVITEPLELPFGNNGTKGLRVEPSDLLEIEYYLDYPPPIGSMHMVFRCTGPEDFKEQIAPARTFGFVKDMRMMDEMGLAGGGRLSNVILLDEEKVINPPLRFSDEFVRHKILDIIGDFYLLGRPFRGKIVATQTGHTENIAMLRLINEKMGIL